MWKSSPPYTDYVNETYTGIVEMIFLKSMRACCAGDMIFERPQTFVSKDDLTDLLMNKSLNQDFEYVLPVQGAEKSEKLIMKQFVPMVISPGSALIVKPDDDAASLIIYAVSNSMPLIIAMLFVVGISGTLFWALENMTLALYGDEPERFVIGIANGIWWAVVTMTTVGYGDHVARTKPGRIFSVFWVIAGVSFCGIFISALTMDLVASLTPKTYELSGINVGVLRSSEEYKYVNKKQGTPFEYDNIPDMVQALRDNTIEYVLIDVFIAGQYTEELKEFKLGRIVEAMTSNGVMYLNKGLKFVQCVRNYIFSSQQEILVYVSENAKVLPSNNEAPSSSSLMDPSSSIFQLSVLGMFGALVVSVIIGVTVQKIQKMCEGVCDSEEERQIAQRAKYRNELEDIFEDIKTKCDTILSESEEKERIMQNKFSCLPSCLK